MTERERWNARANSRLERENSEQLQTISKICTELGCTELVASLNSKTNPDLLLDRINGLIKALSDGSGDNCNFDRQIWELELQLAEKKANYTALQGKIAEYVANAEEYDVELARNEREKAEILAGFQKHANDSNSTFTLSQLEEELHAKEEEKGHLLKEHREVKEMCLAMREQLRSSKDATKQLHQQLVSVRKQIRADGSNQLNQIHANEARIAELQNELRKARQKIQSLKEDNNMLKQVIADDEDFDL